MTRIKLWLMAAGSFLAAMGGTLFWGWLGWKKARRTEVMVKELGNYVETRNRMDEVVVGDDPAAARRWLHERSKSDGGL